MGSVSIQDNLHVLTSADIANIQQAAVNSTLDVVVIIDRVDSRDQLDQRTHEAITRPTTIAIGVDPDHRYTRTNFGNGTGIKSTEWPSIASSGNMDFKVGHWGDGMVDVIRRAQSAARQPAPVAVTHRDPPPQTTAVVLQPTPAPAPAPVSDSGIGFWGVLFWLFLLAVLGTFAYLIFFRRREQETVYVAPDYYEPSPTPPAPPVYVPPPAPVQPVPPRPAPTVQPYRSPYYVPPVAPAPVVVHTQSGGAGDLALGMMVGESLGEARAERRVERYVPTPPAPSVADYTPPPAPRRLPDPEPPPPPRKRKDDDDDAGGSSSSWSSDSSSSSSSSWGSSFDSGGSSSDFGGGGFDGGGSGSDF